MRVRWDWLSLLLVMLLTLVMWPAAGVQAQPTAGRDTVVIGISQEPDYLNPMFAEMSAAASVQSTIFTADVERDSAWKLFARRRVHAEPQRQYLETRRREDDAGLEGKSAQLVGRQAGDLRRLRLRPQRGAQ